MGDKFPDIGPCEICGRPVDSRKHPLITDASVGKASYRHTGCIEREAARRGTAKGAQYIPSARSQRYMRKKFPDVGPCEHCSLPVDSGKDVQLKGVYPDRALYYHKACMDHHTAKRDAANNPPPKQSDRLAMEASDILTRKQAAALLSVHPDTLSKMPVPLHPLPGTKQRRYLKSELVAWVKASSPNSTPGRLELTFHTKLKP